MGIGVSIIICTYNGSKRIKPALEAIKKQEVGHPIELVIVNNCSFDGTGEFVISCLQASKLDWKLVNEETPGLVNARWKGISEARYEYLLFCDDDNYLATDYCQIGLEIFLKNSEIGIIGGKGMAGMAIEKPDWFENFSHTYAVGDLGKKSGIQNHLTYHYGAGIFFKKEILLDLQKKGFKSVLTGRTKLILSSGEDVELCYAVHLLGYKLYYEERLSFVHMIENHRLEWRYYLKLKKGISSSFPILDSYKIEQFRNKAEFKQHLWRELWITIKGFAKSGFLSFLKEEKINQVNFVVSKVKFFSFFSNYQKTLKAFERNKQIFQCH